jgi:hypothetical protein
MMEFKPDNTDIYYVDRFFNMIRKEEFGKNYGEDVLMLENMTPYETIERFFQWIIGQKQHKFCRQCEWKGETYEFNHICPVCDEISLRNSAENAETITKR